VAHFRPMKTLSAACLICALLFCSPCNAAEYVTLIAAGHVCCDPPVIRYSETITLGAGDFAELLDDLEMPGNLEINVGASSLIVGGGVNGSSSRRLKLAGPATIRLRGEGTGSSPNIAVFSITRANSAANVLPANAVVIPEDAGGQYQVILESSTDLLNWAVANPGTYGGSTPKRFFRTRILKLN